MQHNHAYTNFIQYQSSIYTLLYVYFCLCLFLVRLKKYFSEHVNKYILPLPSLFLSTIYLSIYLSIYQSVYPSIYLLILLCICDIYECVKLPRWLVCLARARYNRCINLLLTYARVCGIYYRISL